MKFSLEKYAAKPPSGTVYVNFPIDQIGALRQMRQSFKRETIQQLAKSIQRSTQLNPGIVAALPKEEAALYLRNINRTWGTFYRLTNFKEVDIEEKGRFFLFLVAGERRFRACKVAKLPTYYCQMRFGLSFSDAISLQAHENLHEDVPPQEAAALYALMWRTEKEDDAKLSLKAFAKRMGKSVDYIKRAVRFVTLPVSVQKLILPTQEFGKGVSYGILCELARLDEAHKKHGKPLSETELKQKAYVLLAHQRTVKAVEKVVSTDITHLEHVASGVRPLFDLSPPDELVKFAKKHVTTGLETYLGDARNHLRRVAALHKDESIGQVVSPGTVDAVCHTEEDLRNLAPAILEATKGARGVQKLRKVIG